MKQPRYCIITPARNEGEHLPSTVESVVAQTVRPVRWIIVDDGSGDATGRVADEAAGQNDWITVVHRNDRGARHAGGGVMEAFGDGLDSLGKEDWDYLVKLDGDVTFEADYFERCFGRFAAEPGLGVGGGLVCSSVGGVLEPESRVDPPFHVRGATKIYRYDCWKAIGGLVSAVGWDTVDELKANMLGWSTATFPEIKLIHHRPAGVAYGTWSNWVKNGRANYFTGYHPVFMVLKCMARFFRRPFGIAATGLGVGFWSGYLKRLPRIEDPELIRYLRQQQMKRLFLKGSLWS